jgi:hypothetical protein
MDMRQYLKNRSAAPVDLLVKHRGEWIAWSPDGTHVVASTKNPEILDELVRNAGENPEECVVEGIPEEDSVIGGLDAP